MQQRKEKKKSLQGIRTQLHFISLSTISMTSTKITKIWRCLQPKGDLLSAFTRFVRCRYLQNGARSTEHGALTPEHELAQPRRGGHNPAHRYLIAM